MGGASARAWADLFVFDAATVGPGTIEMRYDMPGRRRPSVQQPTGVAHVVVNGVEVISGGTEVTGALPGRSCDPGTTPHTVHVADVPY